VELLATIQGAMGDRLTGFELMSRACLDHVIKHFPATAEPFSARHAWQVLVELSDTLKDAPLEDALSGALEPAFASGQALDAIIATSEAQSQALWKIREDIPEAEKRQGRSVKHDISLPISRIAEFILRGDAALSAKFPTAQVICFGHIGDGNLHYNLSFPGALATPEQTRNANSVVYSLLDELGGSISAEHGLGQMKREEITRHKSAVELDMMRAVKAALDPDGIMNPGKVL
jgi:FAD/FMN-containing dehydrogenase